MSDPHNTTDEGPWDLLLVTGPSGAGRSTAINALEDIGFEVIDNLPLSLLPRLMDGAPTGRPLALGIDVRNRDFSEEAFLHLIDGLEADPRLKAEVIYLDCPLEVLQQRYSETRRRHPLAPSDAPRVGIEAELSMLGQIRARSDILIDTSAMTPHDLKAEIGRHFAPGEGTTMSITVESFSYKRGVPRGADMVFDCRFLANPHWQEGLRELDGRDARVTEFVAADAAYAPFGEKVLDLMRFLLPSFRQEGKSHFTLCFGCTGGKHRSVSLAETIAEALADDGWQVSTRHRELERAAPTSRPAQRGEPA